MKVCIHILIFAVSSLAVSSQTCPSEHFSAVFVASIDQTIDDPSQFHHDDPELTFLKEVMRFTEEEITHIFEDAMNFFNYTFGLDFSASAPNEQNEHFFENAKMSPFFLSKDLNYIVTANNWIRNGNTRSTCYEIQDGGIAVTFSGDQTLYGSYGGAEGKPVGLYDQLLYAFYRIDVCQQSPVTMHLRCDNPVRIEPVDGTVIFNCGAHNRVLGGGRAQGIGGMNPEENDPGRFRAFFQVVITFPAV